MKRLLCLVCCSVFLFTGCGQTSYFESLEKDENEKESVITEEVITSNDKSTIYVQVAGAVRYPGVYEISADSRVFHVIELAGGLSDEADDSDLNQAEALSDGQKIYVYSKQEQLEIKRQKEKELQNEVDDGLVNINTATLDELLSIPGIGKTKANSILQYRESNGVFSSIEEIKNVSGIGDGIFSQIQSYIKI